MTRRPDPLKALLDVLSGACAAVLAVWFLCMALNVAMNDWMLMRRTDWYCTKHETVRWSTGDVNAPASECVEYVLKGQR